MSRFKQLFEGLKILDRFLVDTMEINPVPNSFPNGTPDYSRSAYINISVPGGVDPFYENLLIERGWKRECEGENWIYQ